MGSDGQRQPDPLVVVAVRLGDALPTVLPSAAFVRSLGQELMQDAAARIALWKKRRRSLTIIGSVVGICLFLASVIGAVVYWTSRSRGEGEPAAGE